MIRAYRTDDLDDVLRVWAAATALAHPFLSDAFVAAERHNIAHVYLPAAETWVWVVAGRAEGFIALVGNEVGGLFLDPALHGRGIGRALMDHARALRGELVVEVFTQNALGRRFYERYGFFVTGRKVHAETGLEVICLRLPPEHSSHADRRPPEAE